jgi:hypothetical protein
MERKLTIVKTGYALPKIPSAIAGYLARKTNVDGIVYNGEFYPGGARSVNPTIALVGKYNEEVSDRDGTMLLKGIEALFGDRLPTTIDIDDRIRGLENAPYFAAIMNRLDADGTLRKAA